MEWVLLITVDDRVEAQAEVDYLRSRNILGRVAGEAPYLSVEVRDSDLEKAKALLAARTQLRTGRLETRSRPFARRAERLGVWLGVGATLMFLLTIVVFAVWSFAGGLGATVVIVLVVALVIFVAAPRSSVSIEKLESSYFRWGFHRDPERRRRRR